MQATKRAWCMPCAGAAVPGAACGVEDLMAGLAISGKPAADAPGKEQRELNAAAGAGGAEAAPDHQGPGAGAVLGGGSDVEQQGGAFEVAAEGGGGLEEQLARLALAPLAELPVQDAGQQAVPPTAQGAAAAAPEADPQAAASEQQQPPAQRKKRGDGSRAPRASVEPAGPEACAPVQAQQAVSARRSSRPPAGQENRDSSNARAGRQEAHEAGGPAGAAGGPDKHAAKKGVAAMRHFWEATAQKGERPRAVDAQALPHARAPAARASRRAVQEWSDDD